MTMGILRAQEELRREQRGGIGPGKYGECSCPDESTRLAFAPLRGECIKVRAKHEAEHVRAGLA